MYLTKTNFCKFFVLSVEVSQKATITHNIYFHPKEAIWKKAQLQA